GNTSLDAANDILLSGAANTQKTTGRNSSSGGGVGVSIGAGKGAGISAFASVNAAKGREKGNGTEWTETTTDSGKTVTINSGRDTVLNGAQVNGNRIIADVGHDLLISSQQDTSKYDSKQTSVAAGGSFTFGSMTGSGYIAASRDKMKSRFDSVAEQTGMFSGDGGFDITVGNHTQLDGAVIASTATADKNSLDTGTLGFSDIHNEADYKVSHSGISLSGGGSFGDKFQGNMPGGMISAGGHSGHAEGTTQAAVADGTITIRDRDNQKQNLANLSRDPAHANDSISPIFDKEKEQRRLQTVGLISDIGSQVADIARTQGELNALKAAQDKYGPVPADATEEQRQAYLAKLRDTPEYKKEQEKYGTGSDMQRGIQAATAALQGLVGGNMAGALAGASAPELANIIGHHAGIDDNTAAKAIAHAILGGVTAALQGNSAAAGAIGAGTGEVIASAIAKSLYPGVDPSKLTEDQKQTVSTLATLSAGMAGGIASGDVAGAAAGAGAGKNVVENNALSLVARGCAVAAPCRTKVAEQLLEIGAKAGMAGLAGAAVKDMADRMTSDELEHLITLQMMGNDEITTKYLSSLHDKYGSGAASNPNIGKDLTDAEKVELGGSGSGTGTPPPSENDPKQQNEKTVDKLNQKQESAIKKIDNTIKNALKDHDIIGTLKDMDGKPVPKENGGYWDHMQEMQNTLRGLRNHADTLKNVNNPEAQAAYGRATDAINKIESALKGYGI
ncbi:hemagglutinin repeat-containing protein, partial [Escherichia coli]|nr:hemagglutinin repeat-containing protein [Escherichia coli]EIA5408983.1 hemagglutinin repeat-containing protein [Escherichia coli]EJJ5995901.1 hemagglutinin repeat-containing protein [Escherichia coli]HAZ8492584.1 Contact-dependent inhibitor A [Escherichia coli]